MGNSANQAQYDYLHEQRKKLPNIQYHPAQVFKFSQGKNTQADLKGMQSFLSNEGKQQNTVKILNIFSNQSSFKFHLNIFKQRIKSKVGKSNSIVQIFSVQQIESKQRQCCQTPQYDILCYIQNIPWRLAFIQGNKHDINYLPPSPNYSRKMTSAPFSQQLPKQSKKDWSSSRKLSYIECLFLFLGSMKGFYELVSIYEKTFQVQAEMIGVNSFGNVRVWCNKQFSDNFPTSFKSQGILRILKESKGLLNQLQQHHHDMTEQLFTLLIGRCQQNKKNDINNLIKNSNQVLYTNSNPKDQTKDYQTSEIDKLISFKKAINEEMQKHALGRLNTQDIQFYYCKMRFAISYTEKFVQENWLKYPFQKGKIGRQITNQFPLYNANINWRYLQGQATYNNRLQRLNQRFSQNDCQDVPFSVSLKKSNSRNKKSIKQIKSKQHFNSKERLQSKRSIKSQSIKQSRVLTFGNAATQNNFMTENYSKPKTLKSQICSSSEQPMQQKQISAVSGELNSIKVSQPKLIQRNYHLVKSNQEPEIKKLELKVHEKSAKSNTERETTCRQSNHISLINNVQEEDKSKRIIRLGSFRKNSNKQKYQRASSCSGLSPINSPTNSFQYRIDKRSIAYNRKASVNPVKKDPIVCKIKHLQQKETLNFLNWNQVPKQRKIIIQSRQGTSINHHYSQNHIIQANHFKAPLQYIYYEKKIQPFNRAKKTTIQTLYQEKSINQKNQTQNNQIKQPKLQQNSTEKTQQARVQNKSVKKQQQRINHVEQNKILMNENEEVDMDNLALQLKQLLQSREYSQVEPFKEVCKLSKILMGNSQVVSHSFRTDNRQSISLTGKFRPWLPKYIAKNQSIQNSKKTQRARLESQLSSSVSCNEIVPIKRFQEIKAKIKNTSSKTESIIKSRSLSSASNRNVTENQNLFEKVQRMKNDRIFKEVTFNNNPSILVNEQNPNSIIQKLLFKQKSIWQKCIDNTQRSHKQNIVENGCLTERAKADQQQLGQWYQDNYLKSVFQNNSENIKHQTSPVKSPFNQDNQKKRIQLREKINLLVNSRQLLKSIYQLTEKEVKNCKIQQISLNFKKRDQVVQLKLSILQDEANHTKRAVNIVKHHARTVSDVPSIEQRTVDKAAEINTQKLQEGTTGQSGQPLSQRNISNIENENEKQCRQLHDLTTKLLKTEQVCRWNRKNCNAKLPKSQKLKVRPAYIQEQEQSVNLNKLKSVILESLYDLSDQQLRKSLKCQSQ